MVKFLTRAKILEDLLRKVKKMNHLPHLEQNRRRIHLTMNLKMIINMKVIMKETILTIMMESHHMKELDGITTWKVG